MSDFGDFLKSKTEQDKRDKEADINAHNEYLAGIQFVYSQIKSWLSEYKENNINIKIVFRKDLIEGETVDCMDIYHYKSKVTTINPKGYKFIGHKAFFDVLSEGKNITYSIIFTRKHHKIRYLEKYPQGLLGLEEYINKYDYEWQIEGPVNNSFKDFNKDEFLNILKNMMK